MFMVCYGRLFYALVCMKSSFILLHFSVFFLTFATLLYRSVMGQTFLPVTVNTRL